MNPDADPFVAVEEMIAPAQNAFIEKILRAATTVGLLPPFMAPKEKLDKVTAQEYVRKAGGDKDKARALARKDGYSF